MISFQHHEFLIKSHQSYDRQLKIFFNINHCLSSKNVIMTNRSLITIINILNFKIIYLKLFKIYIYIKKQSMT